VKNRLRPKFEGEKRMNNFFYTLLHKMKGSGKKNLTKNAFVFTVNRVPVHTYKPLWGKKKPKAKQT